MRLQHFSFIQQIVLNTYHLWDTSLVPESKISQNKNYWEIHSETLSSNRNFYSILSFSNKAVHSFSWLTKNISNNSFASDANTWAAGGEGACLTAKKPFISLPFPLSPLPAGFCFSLSSKISPQKNTVWHIPWSAHQEVHSATEPITWWGLGFEQGSRGAEGAKEKDLWHHQCPGRHPPH